MPELSPDDPLRRDVDAVQRLSAVPSILNLVSALTGLRFSAVARVTNDQWVACAVNDQLAFGLNPGGTLDVTTTLCSEVRDSRQTVVMSHASQDPTYCNHQTPKMYGFESYVSVPIFRKDGSFFGTVCALDPKPNDLKNERVLEQLRLFAELIGAQLDVEAHAGVTRADKARLQSFVMGAPGAIAVLRGPDLVFELANARYQAFVGEKAIMGKPARECLDPTAEIWSTVEEVYRTGKSFVSAEYESQLARTPDGLPAYFSVVVQPTFDADDKVDGVILFAEDVTEVVRAREALEKQVRELDRFAYVASHDLKSPLRAIKNLAQWIDDDVADALPATSREHLTTLRGRVDGMHSLIDGILRLARATTPNASISDIAVGDLLDEVVAMLDLPAGVTVDSSAAAVAVHSSSVELQQIFLNLISNAAKHASRSDCAIRVSASDEGARWRFSVADNGAGIAESDRARLFSGTPSGQRGTGFGLAIVRKIVESRGGTIAVEPTPGGGATFSFTWPKDESKR